MIEFSKKNIKNKNTLCSINGFHLLFWIVLDSDNGSWYSSHQLDNVMACILLHSQHTKWCVAYHTSFDIWSMCVIFRCQFPIFFFPVYYSLYGHHSLWQPIWRRSPLIYDMNLNLFASRLCFQIASYVYVHFFSTGSTKNTVNATQFGMPCDAVYDYIIS